MKNINNKEQLSAMIDSLDALKVTAFDLRSSESGSDPELKAIQMLLADAKELAWKALLK